MELDKKKIGLLALVALALIAVVWLMWPEKAKAEGLQRSGLVPIGEVAAASTNWTGFYVGAFAGKAWGDWNGNLVYDPAGTGPYQQGPTPLWGDKDGARSLDGNGWIGGFSLGANRQTGSVVWGIETDFSWVGLDDEGSFRTSKPNGTPGDVVWDIRNRIDYFGTVRGRLGVASGPVLIYGTGGLAVAQTSSSLVVSQPHVTANGSATEVHVGWTAGGGVEWAFAQNWSLKAEYLYADLGSADYHLTGTNFIPNPDKPHTSDSFPADLTMHIVRAGINYRF